MAFSTSNAEVLLLHKLKTEGPEPEIPVPKAPYAKAVFLMFSNPGL